MAEPVENKLRNHEDVARLLQWLDEVDFTTTINIWQTAPLKWQVNINRLGDPGWIIGQGNTLPEAFADAMRLNMFKLTKAGMTARRREPQLQKLPADLKEQVEAKRLAVFGDWDDEE